MPKRTPRSKFVLRLWIIFAALAASASALGEETRRAPNIILIMADDK